MAHGASSRCQPKRARRKVPGAVGTGLMPGPAEQCSRCPGLAQHVQKLGPRGLARPGNLPVAKAEAGNPGESSHVCSEMPGLGPREGQRWAQGPQWGLCLTTPTLWVPRWGLRNGAAPSMCRSLTA